MPASALNTWEAEMLVNWEPLGKSFELITVSKLRYLEIMQLYFLFECKKYEGSKLKLLAAVSIFKL